MVPLRIEPASARPSWATTQIDRQIETQAATQCNLASCAHECLWRWNNPLRTANTANGTTTTLNACLHCDEIHCSAYYLQACGANRRTAGVVSDIKRPGGDVCAAARTDTMKRMGAAHPDHAA